MSDVFDCDKDGLTPSPNWRVGGHVHNWRNHVGEGIRAIWATFTPAQRRALMLDSEERASNEEWE